MVENPIGNRLLVKYSAESMLQERWFTDCGVTVLRVEGWLDRFLKPSGGLQTPHRL